VDVTKAPELPPVPSGMKWTIAVSGDWLVVNLVVEQLGAAGGPIQKVIASADRNMVPHGRNYWPTQGTVTAVRLAEEILQRFKTANALSEQLGIKVGVEG
jgi:hypothetical protein